MDEYNNDEVFESEEMQEVADPAVESEESQEVAAPEVVEENNSQAEESKEVQTEVSAKTEADSRFAEMRRENERIKAEQENMLNTFKNLGFHGSNTDEIYDAVNAHLTGRDVSEIRQERISRQQEEQKSNAVMQELETLRQRERERVFADDLKTIQGLDPKVKDLKELGEEFWKLKAAGVDTVIAFNAVNTKKQSEKVTPPPVMGKVNSSTTAQKDFYTPEEVDRLTEADLDNPKVMETVMKSMPKWK